MQFPHMIPVDPGVLDVAEQQEVMGQLLQRARISAREYLQQFAGAGPFFDVFALGRDAPEVGFAEGGGGGVEDEHDGYEGVEREALGGLGGVWW